MTKRMKLRNFWISSAVLVANIVIPWFWPHYPLVIFTILSVLAGSLSLWFAIASLLHGIGQKGQLVMMLKSVAVVGTLMLYGFLVIVLFFAAEGLAMGNAS